MTSLGRLVFNAEPNTNGRGAGGWTYAYNDNGELVATSDARGCGENILHDEVGRTVAEDYSPCTVTQSKYSSPSIDVSGRLTGDGTEVFNVYDPSTGRLMDTYDRAQHTRYSYDPRGRVSSLARWLATPTGGSSITTRYAPHAFVKTYTYLASNRPSIETTGAEVPELLAASGSSQVATDYLLQGAIKSITSSYGTVVGNQSVDPTGAVTHQEFGDAALTAADITYDASQNLQTYHLHRAPGPWVPYKMRPPVKNDPNNTLQADLTNLTLGYDRANNLLSSIDLVDGNSWPGGTKPTSLTFTYSDDYRLTLLGAKYGSVSGLDKFVSPFAANEALGDPTFPPMQPVSTGNRISSQGYAYDWLGNIATTSDDADDFLDRSLGNIASGSNNDGPNQIRSASLGRHELGAIYDAAGDLTAWTFGGRGPGIAKNLIEYEYNWDEVGQLSSAIRRDVGQQKVEEDFRYAADGQRILTQRKISGSSIADYTARVFGSLELAKTTFPDAQGDYVRSSATEQLYVGGTHVLYDTQGVLPSAAGRLHSLFELVDPLGSTAFVVDQGTGELVERIAYQPYGSVESDYRPSRWGSLREALRYTGHEDDAEIGCVYFGARYYAPQLGRWISPDPLNIHGLAGDPNPYAFVRGSPVEHTDPLGLQENSGPLVDDGSCTSDACVQRIVDNLISKQFVDNPQSLDVGEELYKDAVATSTSLMVPVQAGDPMGATWVDPTERYQQWNPYATSATQSMLLGVQTPLALEQLNPELARFISQAGIVAASATPVLGTAIAIATVVDSKASTGARTAAGVGVILSIIPGLSEIAPEAAAALREFTATERVATATERAHQIASTLGKSQNFITIGVTETVEGERVISSSEYALRPAALGTLRNGEIAVTGVGHAEVTGTYAARALGLTPLGTAASRSICPACFLFLRAQGVTPLSRLK